MSSKFRDDSRRVFVRLLSLLYVFFIAARLASLLIVSR